MTLNLSRGLCLWAAALVVGLVFILPLSLLWRLLAIVLAGAWVVLQWVRAERHTQTLRQTGAFDGMADVLQSVRQQPVVLVYGDGYSLFGTSTDERPQVRVTAHGCYIAVPAVAQLPDMVAHLVALHPHWRQQLSVLLAINPYERDDPASLAGQVRAVCHQLDMARKGAAPLPLQLVTYLQGANSDEAWFCWESDPAQIRVRHAHTCTSLNDWQRQATDPMEHAQRLRTCIQLNSASRWLAEEFLPHFPVRERVLTCAITLIPQMPRVLSSNLWQQWLDERIALEGARQSASEPGGRLPFPDELMALLPKADVGSTVRLARVTALWMFTLAAALALISSAWQNTLLLRQITQDVNQYLSFEPLQPPDQPGFALRASALDTLHQHAALLDRYYRHGEPLSLGLGLYRGERLRAPLLALLARPSKPLAPPAAVAQAPIRLNSLSLFSVGSAQLKPDATKVLIDALQHIKAQPGGLIVISGHTDSSGTVAHNMQLSRARAEAVRDWLQRMGDLHDSCFAVQGVGADQPIASNALDAGRRANRRVDIRLVPEAQACVPSPAAPDVNPLPHDAAIR